MEKPCSFSVRMCGDLLNDDRREPFVARQQQKARPGGAGCARSPDLLLAAGQLGTGCAAAPEIREQLEIFSTLSPPAHHGGKIEVLLPVEAGGKIPRSSGQKAMPWRAIHSTKVL